MDEEFVNKILGQALAGEKTPNSAEDLWECYKRFLREHEPSLFTSIEQDELTCKKHFLFAIDIFTSVPDFVIRRGVSIAIAAKVTSQLQRSLHEELHRVMRKKE